MMTLEGLREFFFWSTVLNYAVVLCWFLLFALGRDGMHRLHGRWFRIPAERFDAIHYGAMAGYKVGILLFNLVPYIALRLVR